MVIVKGNDENEKSNNGVYGHLYLTGDKINLEPGLKFTGIMNFVISLTD
ncbi:hypothetical protein [Catenibacterium mitsuokai]|nr:hypothetical protein [Catenibacterium mitsuokai]